MKSLIDQRSHQEMILLSVSGLTAFCFFPFIFVRLIRNDWDIAAFNIAATIVMIAFFIVVYKTKKTECASIIISIILNAFIIADIFLAGIIVIYWFYPTLLATYYLISHKIALTLILIAIVILSIAAYPLTTSIEFTNIIISTLILNIFSFFIFRSIRRDKDKLEDIATIDDLTQCFNRRALKIQLSELISRYDRSPFSLSLIIFDLDHFKIVNDTYGHVIGDDALKEVSQIVMSNTRSFEKTYRYGGEEFIILPLEIELKEALLLANKLRILIEEHVFQSGLKLTASMGVAQYIKGELAEDWISRADNALYKAKKSGRNKAVCSTNE